MYWNVRGSGTRLGAGMRRHFLNFANITLFVSPPLTIDNGLIILMLTRYP